MSKKDFLFLHIRDLPYFRGFLRAVESRYYQDFDLPSPILDVGCGDGNFASLTFDQKIDVGLDPWHDPIHEAKQYDKYRLLVESDGGIMPFPDGYFTSAFSNSVLEHIPHVQKVLNETARVLKPGAPFYFCVPNANFTQNLSVARFFDRLGWKSLATAYRTFFNYISRHQRCDNPDVWEQRLAEAGFKVERWWHYFSPSALAALEWGHYLGLPSLISRKFFGRWILVPTRWNLFLNYRLLKKYVDDPLHTSGAYTFYIARLK
jgi:ubiquinone/menaquinone biosynthesis C-methylase UbiE